MAGPIPLGRGRGSCTQGVYIVQMPSGVITSSFVAYPAFDGRSSTAMKLTLLVVVLPAVSAVPTWPWTKPHAKPLKYPGLDVLAKRAGLLYFGTAMDNVVLDNKQYISIAHNRSEFGQVTPSNGQKWMYIEPSQNKFNYTLGDQITVPAKKAGQIRRCHNFVWHNQLPDWVTGRNWTKPELIEVMENHIKNEARHYYNDCYAWDVVNEAFDDDAAASLRKSIFLDVIGKEYIELAFKFARKYTKPGTRLYYNDYAIEQVNNKSRAVEAMGKSSLSCGSRGSRQAVPR